MSGIKSMLGIYAMAMSMGGLGGNSRKRYIEPKESEEKKKQRLANAEINRNKANGLKEFFYGEHSLWALNQKSADKKAHKRCWL